MPVWTCGNTKCTYDKQLQPGQHCPLCGKEAQKFNFNEFGNLLKKKDSLRKTIKKTKEYEQLSRRTKFCPKCGSTNINLPVFSSVYLFYRPSIWKCLNCGYEGAFIIEDSKLAQKIQEHYRKSAQDKKSI